jgi:NADH-quinone oxidoreductase subunit L
MGGLRKHLPITFWTFTAGYLAIIGFPFFAGYFSKDLIILKALEHNPIIGYLLILGALMTAFYMSRVYFLTFFGKFRGTHEQEHHLHESPLTMTFPLMVLAVFSVIGGFLLEHFITTDLAKVVSDHAAGHENHALHTLMYGVTAAVLAVAGYAYFLFVKNERTPAADGELTGFNNLVYNKYYIDEIYNAIVTKPVDRISLFFKHFLEKKVLNGATDGVGTGVKLLSRQIRKTQGGQVDTYFYAMVISIVVMLAVKLFL